MMSNSNVLEDTEDITGYFPYSGILSIHGEHYSELCCWKDSDFIVELLRMNDGEQRDIVLPDSSPAILKDAELTHRINHLWCVFFESGILPIQSLRNDQELYDVFLLRADYLGMSKQLSCFGMEDRFMMQNYPTCFSHYEVIHSLYDETTGKVTIVYNPEIARGLPVLAKSHDMLCKEKARKMQPLAGTYEKALSMAKRCDPALITFFEAVHQVFDEGKVYLAGGNLQFLFGSNSRHSDYDFFLVDQGYWTQDRLQQLLDIMYRIYKTTSPIHVDIVTMRTECAITVFQVTPMTKTKRPWQIVLKVYESLALVLQSFDIDAACLAFDGHKFLTNNRGRHFCQTGYNVFNPFRLSTNTSQRYLKYLVRYQVGILMPGFDPKRIHFSQARFGLSRFLVKMYYRSKALREQLPPNVREICRNVIRRNDPHIPFLRKSRRLSINAAATSYAGFTSCLNSCQYVSSLNHKVKTLMRQHDLFKQKQPFVVRLNSCLVFTPFRLQDDVKRCGLDFFEKPLMLATGNRSFWAVEGPWFAEAYGGEYLSRINQEIAEVAAKQDEHFYRYRQIRSQDDDK
jgi:hypothetical protein